MAYLPPWTTHASPFQLRNPATISGVFRNGISTLSWTHPSLPKVTKCVRSGFILCFELALRSHWSHCCWELASGLLDLLQITSCHKMVRWTPTWQHSLGREWSILKEEWSILKEEFLIRDTKTHYANCSWLPASNAFLLLFLAVTDGWLNQIQALCFSWPLPGNKFLSTGHKWGV